MSPPEVLEGTEIPGGGGGGELYLTLHCHHRGTGGDRDARSWGKRETIPNTTLSPPEVLAGTALLSVLMTRRRGWGGGVYTYRYTVSTRTICALGWSTTTNISMFHS